MAYAWAYNPALACVKLDAIAARLSAQYAGAIAGVALPASLPFEILAVAVVQEDAFEG